MRNCCVVALLLPSLLPAQAVPTTTSDQKCALSGHVTAAGTSEPLNKATVHLQAASAAHSYVAVSNPDGSFQMLNVNPGSYRLWADHDRFLSAGYGTHFENRFGSVLTLKAGQQLTNLDIVLRPQAVIAGKVVDEDGDPTTADAVQVFAQRWVDGKLSYQMQSSEQIDDRGQFRIADLAPGKYVLCAQARAPETEEIQSGGKPNIGPVTTFYPSATNLEDATLIEVHSGQELEGIEIRMRSMRTFHVRGKVTGTLPQGVNREALEVVVAPQLTNGMYFAGGRSVSKTGAFDIAGVGPGTYQILVFAFTRGAGPAAIAQAPVSVAATDINGLNLAIIPPGTVRGRVSVEGTATRGSDQWNSANINVSLSGANRSISFGPAHNASADANGAFTINDIDAGSYKLHVSGAPNSTYLKSVVLNAQEVTGKMIDLSEGGSNELDLVFRYGAADVSGTVQFAQSGGATQEASAANAASSATVVLVPDDSERSESGMKFSELDQNATFHISGVTPGSYHVYAFEDIDEDLLKNPAVVKAISDKGSGLEIQENDSKQIQLSAIPAGDIRQILMRLGLDQE